MKLRMKIIGQSSLIIILLILVIGISSVRQAQHLGQQQMVQYEAYLESKTRSSLISYVDAVFSIVQKRHEEMNSRDYLIRRYQTALKSLVDVADETVQEQILLWETGRIPLSQAQQTALAQIEAMRYDDGVGYFWINDTGRPYPRMIMHPTVPALNGQLMDDPKYNVAYGGDTNLFRAFVDIVLEDGEGFVDYLWPKPTGDGLTEEQPKLSYVRYIEEWDWIIGTGIYIDDALEYERQNLIDTVESMRYDDGVGYFWINDTGRPYPRMIMHPTVPALNGQLMDDPKYNVAYGGDTNLFQAFVDVALEDGEGFVDYLWPKPTGDGLTEEQPKLSYVRYYEPFDWIIGTGVYTDDILTEIEAHRQGIQTGILTQRNMLLAICLISLIISGAFSVLLSAAIVKPVKKMTRMLEDLAQGEGDLSRQLIWSGKDEFGKMVHYHNLFVQKLNRLIVRLKQISDNNEKQSEILDQQGNRSLSIMKNIASETDELVGQIEEVNNVIRSSDEAINRIKINTLDLSKRISKQSASVSETSAAVEQINTSLKNVKLISDDRKTGADVMLQLTKDGGEKVFETAGIIQNVVNNIDKMHELIDVVQAIAAQTDLLSMNAAIEAAHAGDAGKGFAVVADEIRKLAEYTTENVAQISTSLNSVIDWIQQALAASTESGQAFQNIEREVGKVYSSLEEIAQSMSELSTTGESIVGVVLQLRDNAKDNEGNAGQVEEESRVVYGSVEQIRSFMERSTKYLQELKISVKESLEISKSLDDLSNHNKENQEILKRQVSKFKTDGSEVQTSDTIEVGGSNSSSQSA